MILRCRALFVPQAEAVDLLEQALALARRSRRRLDEGHCYLQLAVLASGKQQAELWAAGVAIMNEIGAAAWIDGRTSNNPPAIAMIP